MQPGAPSGGDGSESHPFASLPSALTAVAGRLRVHLAAGRYPGPFVLPEGTEDTWSDDFTELVALA